MSGSDIQRTRQQVRLVTDQNVIEEQIRILIAILSVNAFISGFLSRIPWHVFWYRE